MRLKRNSIRKWSRIIHRDLGYFLIGACLVYAISGFVVSLRSFGIDLTNPSTEFNVQLSPGLSVDSVVSAWNAARGDLPKAKKARLEGGEVLLLMPSCRTMYDPASGRVSGRLYKQSRPFLELVNRLHYNMKGQWRYMGVFFSVGFFLLTITGILMTGGRKGFVRRGVWFMLAGLAIMVLLAILKL